MNPTDQKAGQSAGLWSAGASIDPVTQGSRIRAFVSITNNETHHVALVTSQ